MNSDPLIREGDREMGDARERIDGVRKDSEGKETKGNSHGGKWGEKRI